MLHSGSRSLAISALALTNFKILVLVLTKNYCACARFCAHLQFFKNMQKMANWPKTIIVFYGKKFFQLKIVKVEYIFCIFMNQKIVGLQIKILSTLNIDLCSPLQEFMSERRVREQSVRIANYALDQARILQNAFGPNLLVKKQIYSQVLPTDAYLIFAQLAILQSFLLRISKCHKLKS
jgi:hypothetical protein